MSDFTWPITIDEEKFDEPFMEQKNQYTINGRNMLEIFELHPKLFCLLQDQMQQLDHGLSTFITNISEKFQPELLAGSLGRIKVPMTQWQQSEEHRYVLIKDIQCAEYNSYILPFHDENNQYKAYFIDINETVCEQQLVEYSDANNQSNGSCEDYIFTARNNIEIIYNASQVDDEKDKKLGMKDLCIKYLKFLSNDRLDEIEDSSSAVLMVYILRLRGKHRHGHYGKILSVQGIISPSQWDIIEQNILDIVDEDEDFDQHEAITSYKLTRNKLFSSLKINTVLLIRVFDDFGKELKLQRSLTQCSLYDLNSTGYTKSMNTLVVQIQKKYERKNKTATNICAFNGLRATYNKNTKLLKLTSNSFKSNIGNIDSSKNKVQISQTLGRKGGW